ncbi:MAG: YybH family protein [Natronosporangium sp.]
MTATVDDTKALTELNEQFIDAFRQGSWDRLHPILSLSFSYLDGATGEVWSEQRYIEDLQGKPLPTIGFDQLAIHVDRDVAVVSARTFTRPGRYNRYVDTYHRRPEGWRCVHACVWPLQ